jgi:hypothetical protein
MTNEEIIQRIKAGDRFSYASAAELQYDLDMEGIEGGYLFEKNRLMLADVTFKELYLVGHIFHLGQRNEHKLYYSQIQFKNSDNNAERND